MGPDKAINGRTTNEIGAVVDQMTLISASKKLILKAYVCVHMRGWEVKTAVLSMTTLCRGLRISHTKGLLDENIVEHGQV